MGCTGAVRLRSVLLLKAYHTVAQTNRPFRRHKRHRIAEPRAQMTLAANSQRRGKGLLFAAGQYHVVPA